MTQGQVGALLGFSAMLAVGQTLFKFAALGMRKGTVIEGFLSLPMLVSFWASLALYGCATLLWICLLQSVPLSRAYPFAALGFVIVPGLAALFFAERLSPAYGVGALLIVAGVIVTSRA